MTIEEYDRLNLVFEAKEMQRSHEESKYMRNNADEIAAKFKRERLKEKRKQPTTEEVEEEEEKRDNYQTYEEPGTAARAFGAWETVVTQ